LPTAGSPLTPQKRDPLGGGGGGAVVGHLCSPRERSQFYTVC